MATRIRSTERLWTYLRDAGVRHAVLRGVAPADGATAPMDDDLDLLVDDVAIPDLRGLLEVERARDGVKIDVYGVTGLHGTAYHGHPHLPEPLGRRILEHAVSNAEGLMVPAPTDHLLAWLYHATYHKAEQSGLDWRDGAAGRPTPARDAIDRVMAAAGERIEPTMRAFHARLLDAGLGVSVERLRAYVRHDFRHGRKVLFHARLLDQLPGEMNLFVIRSVALRHGAVDALRARLAAQYQIVSERRVSWLHAWRHRNEMRGGKWRRGGLPRIAVVVFDPHPEPSSAEDRAVHPHVLNRNQFAKQGWRSWFTSTFSVRESANPIHSTDNEAEAIGHLHLFYGPEEEHALLEHVDRVRGGRLEIGPDAGD